VPVPSLDYDLTEVNANAHLDALILINARIALRHFLLHRNRAFDCIEDACELRQQAVTHELEDAPVVLFDLRLEQFLAEYAQAVERSCLVALHQCRVTDHVGSHNSSKVTLDARSTHFVQHFRDANRSNFMGREQRSLLGRTSGMGSIAVVRRQSSARPLWSRQQTKPYAPQMTEMGQDGTFDNQPR